MKLNTGATNIRRTYDGKHTTFTYDTPRKNGCVAIYFGECELINGEIVKITSDVPQI